MSNESHDGTGSGDHDRPYSFGHRLTADAPSPFTVRQFARLQVLRSRVEDPSWLRALDLPEAAPTPDRSRNPAVD
jgi:hypothetical protein